MSAFDDAIDASLSNMTKANNQSLSATEKAAVREALRSAGLESYLTTIIQANTTLVEGERPVYVFWSAGTQTFADNYVKEMKLASLDAGTIGDTAFGKQITKDLIEGTLAAFESTIQSYAENNLGGPLRIDGNTAKYRKTIENIAFNFASQEFADNAVQYGSRARGYASIQRVIWRLADGRIAGGALGAIKA